MSRLALTLRLDREKVADVLQAICHAGTAKVADFDVEIVDELNRLNLVDITRSSVAEATVEATLLGLMLDDLRFDLRSGR
jgi:hypothetical protein